MVKRWKEEIVLGLVLLGCSAFGGFFGAKLAQMDTPKPTATFESSQTFGALPPPPDSRPMSSLQGAPVIVIVVDESNRATSQPQGAFYASPKRLNPIQNPVNFI
ncbi:MAG: hypothetical protein J0I12_12710 [Candidatus Eremiobacteraeota bacterium]|nr:hypothetical protein [Candidatus Eremiobacteraeota bacterium]